MATTDSSTSLSLLTSGIKKTQVLCSLYAFPLLLYYFQYNVVSDMQYSDVISSNISGRVGRRKNCCRFSIYLFISVCLQINRRWIWSITMAFHKYLSQILKFDLCQSCTLRYSSYFIIILTSIFDVFNAQLTVIYSLHMHCMCLYSTCIFI